MWDRMSQIIYMMVRFGVITYVWDGADTRAGWEGVRVTLLSFYNIYCLKYASHYVDKIVIVWHIMV